MKDININEKCFFFVSSIRKLWKSHTRDDGWPSYALKLMEEVVSLGDPSFCQTNFEKMHVDSPSSMMHQ